MSCGHVSLGILSTYLASIATLVKTWIYKYEIFSLLSEGGIYLTWLVFANRVTYNKRISAAGAKPYINHFIPSLKKCILKFLVLHEL